MYRQYIKRLMDIILSVFSLVVFSPLMVLVAIAIRLEDGGPAIFRQIRVSQYDGRFILFKFRSMPVNTSNLPSAKAEVVKITKVGCLIRRANIDELPQLFNVLRGEMSIIGPRPSLPIQKELNNMRRINGAIGCRPGLTGLAQVNSYDGMPEIEKANWDGKYANSISFVADIKIIFKTFVYFTKRPPVY